MNPRDFILEVYDGKIILGNALGIIRTEDGKPSFMAGRLGYINFVPNKVNFGSSKTDYFSIDIHVPSTVYCPCLGEFIFPTEDEAKFLPPGSTTGSTTERIYKDEKMNRLFSKREEFENEMNNLMDTVQTKKRLPLFVRNLSKIPGWQ